MESKYLSEISECGYGYCGNDDAAIALARAAAARLYQKCIGKDSIVAVRVKLKSKD